MNSKLEKLDLVMHPGHNVGIAGYGGGGTYENIALECNDCSEILADADVNNLKLSIIEQEQK